MKNRLIILILSLLFQNTHAQWTKIGLPEGYANCLTKDNNGNLYAGLLYSGFSTAKKSGVYFSSNGGNSWTDIGAGLPQLTVNDIMVVNNAIFVAMPKGKIYKSIDNGASWVKLNTGIDSLTYVMHLESFGGELFAGTNNDGIYISKDYGESWQKNNSGIFGKVTNALYATPTDLFAAVNNKYVYHYDPVNSSWSGSGNGMPNSSINALCETTDANGNKYLFAGLYSSVTELTVSTDNGVSWSASDAGLPNVPVYTLVSVGSNLFLGNDYGVYLSKDFGASWSDVSGGYSEVLGSYAYFLIVEKSDLFVVSKGAVWKRALSDFGITDVKEIAGEIPNSFELFQNYPNPFNPSTTIKYSIPNVETARRDVFTTLKVYDVLGKEVATLVNEKQNAGNYEVKFNAVNLPSGVYFSRLSANGLTQTKKMILLK